MRFRRTKRVDFETSTKAIGGSIRAPRSVPVTIDKRKAAFTKALYDEEDEFEESFADNESNMYSHYGGQLSGYGAAHDPPHVRQFMHNTLKQYPKILHAYNQGRVVNPPERQTPYSRSSDAQDIVDYGGSVHPFSHSENGRLVVFDHSATSIREYRR